MYTFQAAMLSQQFKVHILTNLQYFVTSPYCKETEGISVLTDYNDLNTNISNNIAPNYRTNPVINMFNLIVYSYESRMLYHNRMTKIVYLINNNI